MEAFGICKLPSQFQLPSSPIDASHRQLGIARSQTATGTPAQEMPTPDSEAGNVISSPPNLNPRERYVQLVVEAIEQKIEGETTIRERLMAKALVSAIGIHCAAFILFVLGIELLVWNTQPLSVSVFTSVLLGLNLLLMVGFFLKHRRKRVIGELALRRAEL
ncbi:hypothetical protein CTheo_8441 [Ceratobasidium theobromae]|uniref:Transmembrane protein n=1 Tax=Ceratobasidium theobromae TaxID=1582974 RepID=A0A5N5Q928_9AGAM|nr:hypothetical protein CTheo_8441 [Ceratobasidium theobromae]